MQIAYAGINVKTEGWGGGTGRGAAFEFFCNFLVKFPTLGTGKKFAFDKMSTPGDNKAV